MSQLRETLDVSNGGRVAVGPHGSIDIRSPGRLLIDGVAIGIPTAIGVIGGVPFIVSPVDPTTVPELASSVVAGAYWIDNSTDPPFASKQWTPGTPDAWKPAPGQIVYDDQGNVIGRLDWEVISGHVAAGGIQIRNVGAVSGIPTAPLIIFAANGPDSGGSGQGLTIQSGNGTKAGDDGGGAAAIGMTGGTETDGGDLLLQVGAGAGGRDGQVIGTFPTTDPAVAGALWQDPAAGHALKVSQG